MLNPLGIYPYFGVDFAYSHVALVDLSEEPGYLNKAHA